MNLRFREERLRRRARALGACFATIIVLTGCGSGPKPASTPRQPAAGAPTSAAFEANGHRLYIECVGPVKNGTPTMVLEVGEARLRGDLVNVQDAYGSHMRVCSYDRANKGDSGTAATPRKGGDIAADLHDLLAAARVPGPYLLVGHSAGGLIAEAYAARYPGDVAGVVAINPVAPWKSWVPVMEKMGAQERKDEVAFLTGNNGESLDYRDIGRAVEGHLPMHVPTYVLVSSPAECPPDNASCASMIAQYDTVMRHVARQWGARIKVVDASHDIQFDDLPSVTAAIDDVLSRAHPS